jgi:hypothetical protein
MNVMGHTAVSTTMKVSLRYTRFSKSATSTRIYAVI